jgi:TonB family protein
MKRSTLDAGLSVGLLFTGILFAPASPVAAATLPSDKVAEPALMGGPNDLPYLTTLHAHVHKRWTDNFLALVGQNLALGNPLNDAARAAEVDVVVSARGKLVSATITKSSGVAGFDDAVVDVLRDSVPFPAPPIASRSDDDNLHLHWTFARDERRCAGVVVLHVDDPLEIAVPKLMKAGRRDDIVARLSAARAGGVHAEPAMTSLANEWLRGAGRQSWTTVRIAGTLAAKGDADAIAFLKAAAKAPATAREAGALLAANRIAICPLVKAGLEGGAAAEQLAAAQALATSGETACAPALVKMLGNAKLKPEARAAAATALGPIDDDAARDALAAAAKDEPNLAVKAAAALAQIRPGAGRAKMLGMVHLLKEPSIEMRTAGSAGVVRAGGDADFDDLYMLFRDTDPRPAEATLRELDGVKGEKATSMIAKLMRRPLVPVQRLAAELLVKRHAKSTFAGFAPLLESNDAELHGLGLVAADDSKLAGASADPKLGIWAYRARLARGERDRAADWLLAALPTLSPGQQADAMVDWLASAEPPTTTASKARR